MCTIAGVKIGSLEREVSPKVLEEVEAALVKMKLKVKYQKGPEWKKGAWNSFVSRILGSHTETFTRLTGPF